MLGTFTLTAIELNILTFKWSWKRTTVFIRQFFKLVIKCFCDSIYTYSIAENLEKKFTSHKPVISFSHLGDKITGHWLMVTDPRIHICVHIIPWCQGKIISIRMWRRYVQKNILVVRIKCDKNEEYLAQRCKKIYSIQYIL